MRKIGIVASFVFAACALARPVAQAQPAAPPRLAACAACHGAQGEGGAPGAPRLAGQDAGYLENALTSFKSGRRTNPIMQPIAGSLTDSDIHDLALYFGSLNGTRVLAVPSPAAALVGAGKVLALDGSQATSTPACFSCHGAGGHGVGARVPGIAGQPMAFVVDRLHEFQARARTKTPAPASMTAVSATLSEAQITQVAAFLSTLSPWPSTPAAGARSTKAPIGKYPQPAG
jgi:cytochrome c553